MIAWVARFALVLAVAAGILLPKLSAAAVSLGLADLRIVVICSGDGLRLVTLDADGQPVEVSAAEHCALVGALDRASPPAFPVLRWELVGEIAPARSAGSTHAARPEADRQPRAPPFA